MRGIAGTLLACKVGGMRLSSRYKRLTRTTPKKGAHSLYLDAVLLHPNQTFACSNDGDLLRRVVGVGSLPAQEPGAGLSMLRGHARGSLAT